MAVALILTANTLLANQVRELLVPLNLDVLHTSNEQEAEKLAIDNLGALQMILLEQNASMFNAKVFISNIRKYSQLSSTQIFAITTLTAASDISSIFKDGFDDFIQYPIKSDELNIKIQKQLHIKTLLSNAERRILDLEQQLSASKSSNDAKSRFVATMSHELRTPLNGIIGFSSLLDEQPLDETCREYNKLIRSSACSLLEIVNGVLDFSKIEAGKLELYKSPVLIQDVLNLVHRTFELQADKKGILVILKTNSLPDKKISADETRLKQVLINLVGNSMKFTPVSGAIILMAETIQTEEKRVLIEFSVSDSGIGLNKEQINSIFEPFQQAESTTNKIYGGTGLGLSITKELVEIMGGEITVSSLPERGSRFSFRLWLDYSEDVAKDVYKIISDQTTPTSLKVLVAEDHPVNQKLILTILKKKGFDVTVVDNGQEAVNAAGLEKYDLVLMDCEMPVLNGYEATKQIRKMQNETDRRLPIIAVTGNAMTGDLEKCRAAGMDCMVSKPINSQELFAVIAEHTKAS